MLFLQAVDSTHLVPQDGCKTKQSTEELKHMGNSHFGRMKSFVRMATFFCILYAYGQNKCIFGDPGI